MRESRGFSAIDEQLVVFCVRMYIGALLFLRVRDLDVCWNDCFRYKQWESLSELQQVLIIVILAY